jgi:cytochrome c553
MIADSSRENICFVCHDSQSAVTGTEHNMTNIDYVNEELKKKSKENVCYVCHKPHNFSEDVNFMWAFKQKTDEPFAFEICFNCHSDEGAGYKKVPEVYDHDKIFKIFPYREQYKEYLYSNEGEVSAAGSITCQTCHNPHVWKEGAENLHFTENTDGDEKNSFLKQKVSGKFCTVCHGEEGKTLFDKYHDKNYRDGREKKLNEKELLKRLYEIRERLERMKQNE